MARRSRRDVRPYHNGPDDPENTGPLMQGWSASEIRRQEQLSPENQAPATQDTPEIVAERMLDAIDTLSSKILEKKQRKSTEPSETWKVDIDPDSEFVPHLRTILSSRLMQIRGDIEVGDLFSPYMTAQQQAALRILRDIIRTNEPGRQQEALDLYINHKLVSVLSGNDHVLFRHYLYESEQRSHVETFLKLYPASQLVPLALLRLGRVQEAAALTLNRLYNKFDTNTRLQTLVVMDEIARRGDHEFLFDVWQEAVMSPTVPDAYSLLSEPLRFRTIEQCLAAIQNPKDWYIAKAAKIISDPNIPPKKIQFIRVFGEMFTQTLAHTKRERAAHGILSYITDTFGEVGLSVLFVTMSRLRYGGQAKQALELYLSYRNNEFATIEPNTEPNMEPEFDPETLEGVVKKETRPDLRLCIQNEAMAAASALNNLPLLKQAFEDIYALDILPDTYSYTIIMHACALHGQAKTVRQLLDTYKESGREPDQYMYTQLLYVQVMLLDIPAAEAAFQECLDAGVDAGAIISTMLTSVYTRTLDVDSAMRVFQMYIKSGRQPDAQMIGMLITMFANRHDTDAAVEMFNLIGEFGLSPVVHCFNQLLNAYANVGDHVNGEAVVAKMREVGLKPDAVTYSTLIKLYSGRKDLNSIIEVLGRMRREGVQPNDLAWTELIVAFGQFGGKHAPMHIRRLMRRMTDLGIRLNVYHWNGLLDATILATNDLMELQLVYDEMLASGIRPSQYTYGLLVSAYCKYGGRTGLDISLSIVERLSSITDHVDLTSSQSPRTALHPSLFVPIFKTQSSTLPYEHVQEVFDNFVRLTGSASGSETEPNLGMLVALIDVYRQHGDIMAVKRVWKEIKDRADRASRSYKSTPEETTEFVIPGNRFLLCTPFDHYIRALADHGELDEIDAVWDQLSQEGYDFSCENWNTRIKLCLIHHKHIVWAFRACDEVLMDGYEARLRMRRKKVHNPPSWIRERRVGRRLFNMVNRVIWPIENDLMDERELPPADPKPLIELEPQLFPYQSTLEEFLMLRRRLLLGASIIDSSGRTRPGLDVWERLKQAFPRIVRAMLLHLRRMKRHDYKRVSLDFERETFPRNRARLEKERKEEHEAENTAGLDRMDIIL